MNPQNVPNNIRHRNTGKLELRKLWAVPDAKFIWGLYVEYEQQTAELVEDEEGNMVPDWEKIKESEFGWQCPQGYLGDEEWGRRTAEHFEIEFPEEEYKPEEEKE